MAVLRAFSQVFTGMAVGVILLTGGLVRAADPGPRLSSEWNRSFHYRGNLERTGVSDVSGLRKLLGVEWEIKPGFRDFGALSLADGLVVVGNATARGGLYAFDAKTGQRVWYYATGHVQAPPAIVDGTVYIGTTDTEEFQTGMIAAVSLATGKELWKIKTEQPELYNSPAPFGDRVFIRSLTGTLYSLDRHTGKTQWTFRFARTKGTCYSSPAVANGLVYVSGGDDHFAESDQAVPWIGHALYAVDTETGQVKWRFETRPDPEVHPWPECLGQPVVSQRRVYAVSKHVLYALDAQSGVVQWKAERVERDPVSGHFVKRNLSNPVVAGETIYAFTTHGLVAWDGRDGRELWNLPGQFPEAPWQILAVAGNTLYFSGNFDGPREKTYGMGWIYALDLQSRRLLWRHETPQVSARIHFSYWGPGSLILDNGALYYTTHSMLRKLH